MAFGGFVQDYPANLAELLRAEEEKAAALPRQGLSPAAEPYYSFGEMLPGGEGIPPEPRATPEAIEAANIANMGKKQVLDYNASQPSKSLAQLAEEERQRRNAAEGWVEVPGTQSFMRPGEPGRYRYTGTMGEDANRPPTKR